MTKKHFTELAEALSEAKPSAISGMEAMTQWYRDIAYVADACQKCNPRFDKAKFLKAAEGR